MSELIAPAILKELVATHAIRTASVIGDTGGFKVVVKYGKSERFVAAKTREGTIKLRLFRTLDGVARYMQQIGMAHYEVDAANYRAGEGPKRPDRSEALRAAHKAAAYNKWLKAEVQEAIDDPGPSIPHEEVMRDVRKLIRQAKVKRASA